MTGDQHPVVAVNPDTGEVLEHLEQQPPEVLAEYLDAVNRHQARLKDWNSALQGELRRRLKLRRTRLIVFGDWEVELTRSRSRDWDADGLEPVLKQLVDEGVVRAGDVTDVITRTPAVSPARARDLLARLDGEAQTAVEACFTWHEKAGGLTVTRSQQLLPAAKEAPPPEIRAADAAAGPPSQSTAQKAPLDHDGRNREGVVTDAAAAPTGPSARPPFPIDPSELFA